MATFFVTKEVHVYKKPTGLSVGSLVCLSIIYAEQGEGCGVGGSDAPSFGIKVVDATTHAFARAENQATIAKRDRASGSIYAECLATKVLQGLGVGQFDARSIFGSEVAFK